MNSSRNKIETLQAIAFEKKKKALEKTEQAITALIKAGKRISIAAVARQANVSQSYLYKYPELKERIQRLRDQQSRQPLATTQSATEASNRVIVTELRHRLKKLDAQLLELRNINESLAGQVHQLIGQKALAERIQSENKQLKKQLDEYHRCRLTPPNNTPNVISTVPQKINTNGISKQVLSELKTLKIKLNSTLIKKLNAANEETILNAIESLKQALEFGDVRSPSGWLASALSGGWVKNESLKKQQQADWKEEFEQWYQDAVRRGVVLDIPINHLNSDRNNEPLVKLNKPGLFGAPYTEMPWREAQIEL